MPAFILAVPRATKPLDPRYEINFVDIKRLFSIILVTADRDARRSDCSNEYKAVRQ